MDFLADVSGADVFDQVSNPEGTQRELKRAHAKEAYEYAVGSLDSDPFEDARAFTEVILNARQTEAVELIVEGKEINFSELELELGQTLSAELVFHLGKVRYPSIEYEPDISRVDGNHRLSSVDSIAKRNAEVEFPLISFALFVGLTKAQELKVFADINGKQQKMDTSHLNQILANQNGDRALLSDKHRSQWFAKQMSSPNKPFSGLVFMGGSKRGIKKRDGVNPPLTFTGLTTMMGHTLKAMEELVAKEVSSEDCAEAASGNQEKFDQIQDKFSKILVLVERYWLAVKEVFPEAWNDKKKVEYLLFDSTGNNALSMLAGSVITAGVKEKKVTQEDFNRVLRTIREEGVSLRKQSFPQGLAGMAGTKVVYERLVEAKDSGDTGLSGIVSELVPEPKSKLDE